MVWWGRHSGPTAPCSIEPGCPWPNPGGGSTAACRTTHAGNGHSASCRRWDRSRPFSVWVITAVRIRFGECRVGRRCFSHIRCLASADGRRPRPVKSFSDEGGELTRAIVFYMIRRDPGQPFRSNPSHPEPLFSLKFDGKVLDFKVSHRRSPRARTKSEPPVPFRLRLTGPNKGLLIRDKDEHEALEVQREKIALSSRGKGQRFWNRPHPPCQDR